MPKGTNFRQRMHLKAVRRALEVMGKDYRRVMRRDFDAEAVAEIMGWKTEPVAPVESGESDADEVAEQPAEKPKSKNK